MRAWILRDHCLSVRVVEVIRKTVIGRIPNENRELVTLRDMVESQRCVLSPVSLVRRYFGKFRGGGSTKCCIC